MALLPALHWLRHYPRANLSGDLGAGVTVAVMLVPQGIAYAQLAGLPPVHGLYAATLPLIAYALFGSSPHLSVGPVAIISLFTFSGVSALATPGSGEFLALAALLAVMVGVFQLLLGLVRVGFVINFVSHAVISGFTSAAAIVIGLSQLRHLLGVPLDTQQPVYLLLANAARQLGDVHLPTVMIGVMSIALLLGLKRWRPRIPAALIVVALGGLAVYLFGLDTLGVRSLGEVPRGVPALSLPVLRWESVWALFPTALTISFVGFMESVAMAKTLAAKDKQPREINANQELIGLGLANLAAGMFSGYPVTGGFSRSAVNHQAGARTGLASIISALLVMLTLLLLTPLFSTLPQAALAAIVMVAVARLVDMREAKRLFYIKRADGWCVLVTFVATLLIGIEEGILIGVAFSLLAFIYQSAYPHTTELGYLSDEGVFRNTGRYPEAETFPGVLIVRSDAPLYFANMGFLTTWLEHALSSREPTHTVILDFAGVNDMDAVAIERLERFIHTLAARGTEVYIAGMKGPVRDLIHKAGWHKMFGPRIFQLSVAHALKSLGVWPEARPLAPTPAAPR